MLSLIVDLLAKSVWLLDLWAVALKLPFAAALLTLALAAPAQAAVILYAESPAGRIDLHDEPGVCVNGALRAEFVAPDGSKVPGCWRPAGDVASIGFFDGDAASIPRRALKKPDPA